MLADSNSIQSVLELLTPRLRIMIFSYHISSIDGEDLIQEAILAILPKWGEIQNKEGWLLNTVRNLCSAHQRRQKCWSRLVQSTDAETLQKLARALSPPQIRTEYIEDLKRLLGEVGGRDRYLLYLKFYEELGPTELASRMGCHPANVRKMALRILRRLHVVAKSSSSLRQKRKSGSLVPSGNIR
jgi:RNA polymerase sigma factor (sigma-70 family)